MAESSLKKTIEIRDAIQLNIIATIKKRKILFFLHADSIPSSGFRISAAANNN